MKNLQMPAAADADVVRRDSALPGLAMLLDPDAFVETLRHCLPDADLGAARITYVKYKPETNCLAGFRLDVNGSTVDVYAKTYPKNAQGKLRKAREFSGVPGPLGSGRIVLEDFSTVVSAFPNDSKVSTLAFLANPEARADVFRMLFPDRRELWHSTLHRLVYKPERRFVARVITEVGHQALLKVSTEDEYRASRWNSQVFRSRGSLRIASPLRSSPVHRMLVFEWLSGYLLSEAISDPDLDLRTVATTGAALAELHAQDPDGLAARIPAAKATSLRADATWLGRVCPALAGRAADLARHLTARLAQAPETICPIHGDFHPRQVLLLGNSTVGILDLDNAARGDPAEDLGNFVAHLHREVVRSNLLPGRVEPLRAALLEGYGSSTQLPSPVRDGLYTAVGLFRLALRFFRYREQDWPERTEATLALAESVLKTAAATGGRSASRRGD